LQLEPKVRVGVVGAGVMAKTHIESLLAMPGAALVAVSAPMVDPAVSELCRRASIPVKDDSAWLLERARLDAVVVATPTDHHGDIIARAAAAGLHVFCEKPLARSARQARAAADACSQAGTKLSVGHVVRYFPAYADLRQAVIAGRIGPPGMAKCRRVSGPPAAARAWYADTRRSGGLIMDMGVHDFDWLRWCLGPVERVSALVAGQGQVAMIGMAHTSGAISSVELSWMEPRGFAYEVEVSGPGGLLSHDSRGAVSFSLDLWPAAGDDFPAARDPDRRSPAPASLDNPYYLELADALTWFGGGPAPRSTALDGVTAVALAEAAELSATTGEPVTVTEAAMEGTG
jgi:UDP-N-acetylglucosamine 3-dehydrogenase